MRLLPGLLVGQSGSFTLDGDESIRRRPVDRVAMPLRLMGAVLGDSDGRPPLHIDGGGELQPIGYELPVASAQVKSCILLAGLYAVTGPTTVIEPVPTRDHTERMLRAAGARVAKGPRTVSVWPVERLRAGTPSTCPATSPRPRRSWSPRRCWPSRACSSAACRPTRRAPGC